MRAGDGVGWRSRGRGNASEVSVVETATSIKVRKLRQNSVVIIPSLLKWRKFIQKSMYQFYKKSADVCRRSAITKNVLVFFSVQSQYTAADVNTNIIKWQ